MPRKLTGHDHGESTLREARCSLGSCSRLFYICPDCDYGQTYCSDECRTRNQRRLHRQANQRHQQSREGKRDHADRQRHYRARERDREYEREKVTDTGSAALDSCCKLSPPVEQSVAIIVQMEPSREKRTDHVSTSCSDSPVPGPNAAMDELGEHRTTAGGAPAERSSSSTGSSDASRGPLALGGAAPLRCGQCGRPGIFVRFGPVRRLRARERDRPLRRRGARPR